jgi:O-antigen/teichoic acid export membrane protein
MSQALKQRLIKGFAAQGFGQVVNLVVQVISVPLFLHYWGKIVYGEWLLLSSVLGYLAISDLSFGSAAQNEMAMRVGRGDKQGALSVFQSSWVLVTLVSLIIMLLSLLLIWLMPLEVWLHLSGIPHSEVVAIVDLLVLQVILAQQGGLLSAGFRCDGNLPLGVMAMNVLRLLEFCVSIMALVLHQGMQGVALVVLLMRIVGYIAVYALLRRRSPWLYLGRQYASYPIIKPLIGPAISYNAFPLGYALNLQGVVTVVGIYMGAATVTLFSTLRTLTRVILQMLNAVAYTVWVEFSTAFGAGDLALARNLHRRACQLAFWGALAAAGFLAVCGGPVYRLWTHNRVPFDPGLFYVLLLVIVCTSIWSTSYTVPLSVNKHQRLAAVFLTANLVSLLLAVLGARMWGVMGVAVSLFAVEIVMSLYVVRRSLELLEDNFSGFAQVVLTPPFGWLVAKLNSARLGAG